MIAYVGGLLSSTDGCWEELFNTFTCQIMEVALVVFFPIYDSIYRLNDRDVFRY